MTTAAYADATGQVGRTDAATFIPEVWSDDIIAAYKKSLVAANIVTKINHVGKKGDTINIPAPTRDSASAKAENTAIKIIANTEGNVAISIIKHYEYSRLIEDIVSVQALNSLRKFYTEDAGYALARQTDTDIIAQFEGAQGGVIGAGAWAGAVARTAASTITDPYVDDTTTPLAIDDYAIRYMVQTLDDADVPMDNRALLIPPVARNSILSDTHFTSADFVSGRPVMNGQIGTIYGVDVYVSTNAPTTATAGDRICVMTHKDAVAFAEQMGVRTQTQYKQEYLADLMTADCIYGVGELRNDASIALAIPA